MVSLEAELQHMRSASDSSNSHYVAMFFDGSTLKSKSRLFSPLPTDFERFREKYEVITNVGAKHERAWSMTLGTSTGGG